ncbi:MAG: 1-acyl-sn-glycerol-3-phosphate acyltransferase [Clostridia bacterium]|nr:1-acyl-sn-glycerol-3-phosphate acyltransferase [Clostridia bacterium]
MEVKKTDPQKDAKKRAVRQRAWRLAHRLVRPVFERKYAFTIDALELEPPFLMIANHAMNIDPILVSIAYKKQPLSFVASEHLGRLGLTSKLLNRYFSIISRSKASNAMGTVKSIMRALRKGDPVLLFAEGDCTWDGVSGKVFPATGKLAKAVGVPLVTYLMSGTYLTRPRWAEEARKGFIRGRLVHVYSKDELSEMTPEEVTAAINADIYEDAWQGQLSKPTVYAATAPAKGIEKALFICPECGGIDCIFTNGIEVFCEHCGRIAKMNEYELLDECKFRTVREWELFQREKLREYVQNGVGSDLFKGTGKLSDLAEGKPKSRKAEFSLDIASKCMTVNGERIPLSEISDMAMVKTNRLLISYGRSYYEIFSKRGILRPYLMTWQALRENTEGE